MKIDKLFIKWGLLLVFVIGLVLVIRPIYMDYIAIDRSETCEKARLMVCLDYGASVHDHPDWNMKERQTELSNIVDNYYKGCTLLDETSGVLRYSGICRSGGTITFTINADNGSIATSCDIQDHEDLVW